MQTLGFPKRAIVLDFHTMPGVTDVGRDFDAEEFAGTLESAGVDCITVFNRCNLGFCYYPTEVGIFHPGLQQDLFGPILEACHRRGIRVRGYINVGIDHEHARRHRDWCKVSKQGHVYRYDQMGHRFRDMCLNTGYREHVLALIREVVERYPIDGMWLDCFNFTPCYGSECLEGMRALQMDPSDDQQAADYCRRITEDFVAAVKSMIQQTRGDLPLYFHDLPFRQQPSYIEIEVFPTGGWGYDYIPAAARYVRTLGKPFSVMTGRFPGCPPDIGGIRPYHALLYDCLMSVANGGACSILDQMHPRARLEPEVYRLIGTVYSQVRALEPWVEGTTPVAEIAVVDPELASFGQRWPSSSVKGACRVLGELKYQFDVSDGDSDLSRYRTLVLPDTVTLSEGLRAKLSEWLEAGGVLLSSARSGLTEGEDAFALAAYSMSCEGPEPHHPTFFRAEPSVSENMPEMLTAIYEPGIAMRAGHGAEVLATLHQPYFNVGSWDWFHENLYVAPDKDSGRPVVVRSGNVVHISFPLFSAYARLGVVSYRTLVRNCLRLLLPAPILEISGLPSFGRATMAEGEGKMIVHLLNYVPELRGTVEVIEEPICSHDVVVRLRTDGGPVHRALLAPSGEVLEVTQAGGYASVTVPVVRGYQMVVLEGQPGARPRQPAQG